MLTDDEVQRALVIVAHPDDVDFGAAGTVGTWTGAGIEVAYCIVTDGDAGGFDPNVPRAEIPSIRRAEQTAAAKVVGVSDIAFLGYPDGRLLATLELRRDLAREIRRVRPQRVLCPSPERNWQRIFASHPDHLAAGEASMAAVYPDARNPFAHPELLEEDYEPWSVVEVWMMASPTRNRWVDITDSLPRKLDALRSHVSQHTDVDAKLEERMRDWSAMVAQEAGLPDGRLAEGFFAIDSAG
jgi:LmbE family N-acetylglucosaminyl deacetylase